MRCPGEHQALCEASATYDVKGLIGLCRVSDSFRVDLPGAGQQFVPEAAPRPRATEPTAEPKTGGVAGVGTMFVPDPAPPAGSRRRSRWRGRDTRVHQREKDKGGS